jgi:imidazolonepropionase
VRVHAEQLSRSGGALLAAEAGALSAGHLEHATPEDIEALAKAGVACEVLSIAQVFLRGQRAIPGRALVDGGCTVAVATDCNPGTAMSTDLPLAAGLAVTQCGLTAEEALRGITVNAARALGLTDRGVIAAGKRADLVVLDATSPLELVYRWSDARAHAVVAHGRVVLPAR